MILVMSYLFNIFICFDALMQQDYLTRIVWSGEPEMGVKISLWDPDPPLSIRVCFLSSF